MRNKILLIATGVAALFAGACREEARLQAEAEPLTYSEQELTTRSWQTDEGTFSFEGLKNLQIKDMPPLTAFVYSTGEGDGQQGVDRLEFYTRTEDGGYRPLMVDTSPQGAAPYQIAGIDVLPSDDGADILVRWASPQSENRLLKMYRYTGEDLFLARASAYDKDFGRNQSWQQLDLAQVR